ncbi:MAG: hypothetical protein BJ554DRAFT_3228 [Olpidium bornovanus]|uniref:Uncharacterized protein n=1 Tax=Olpidium bornovanus TaxID=278681 RepID=A0A8H7ZPI3_9FUNG|nr:MAG: hypothetical protein BJ554DRAFT_3228 [Olpidium bornovanus]
MLAPVLVEAPKRATKFAANEQFQQLYMRLLKLDKPTPYLSVLTGVSAGLTEAMLVTSFELIKIRMQDKNNVGLYNGTFDCIKKIYRAEGVEHGEGRLRRFGLPEPAETMVLRAAAGF